MPAPLVGVDLGGPATLEHVTLAIDDQLHARPEDSLGGAPGAPGPGSDAAGAVGRSFPMSGRVILHGLRISAGRGGPLLNSIVVGDADPSPVWHETRGVFAVEPEMTVEDSLIWGFDRATLAVLARRIVQDDPLFIDRPGGDMRPSPQSPAVGQAAASAVEIDLYGVDRADPATLGALEPRGPEIIGAD